METNLRDLAGLETQSITTPERRRERREPRRVAVEVSGFDARGRFFTERTSTIDAGDSSCSFLLDTELLADSVVSIRVIRRPNAHDVNTDLNDERARDDAPVPFCVASIRQTHPGWPKWTIAATQIQPGQPSTLDLLSGGSDPRAEQESPSDTPNNAELDSA